MTLNRKYIPATATLVNNGFNVGIHFEENAGVIGVDGKDYRLQQIHWRTPSEHNINGKAYDAELQLLHKADDGSIFMGAILYQIGNGDIVLTKVRTISKQQLELLKAPMLPAFKSNSRPVQPDNGRQVVLNYDQRMKS
nr:PREDICTED: alpha carbonic anhydrase 1, chloroplastic-like [Daucus carota subsp. sativus]